MTKEFRIKNLELRIGIVVLIFIFIAHIFLRFYDLEGKSPFGWDQLDNAWVAKNIIVDHRFPITGMQAKLNSGINIGPLYYYLNSIFYYFTNLDPIASPIFAAVTSIFSFLTLFYITKKLFSFNIALIAVFLNTVSFYSTIYVDRVQWPVDFIPAISIIIFYCLYKVTTNYPKYLVFLSIALGFMFHIHFTAIFFPIIIILLLPFFPKTKEMLKYAVISIPLFFIWIIPSIVAFIQNSQHVSSLLNYGNTNYHGFHLRRFLGLTSDAFIQFDEFFAFSILKPLKFVVTPIFAFIYIFRSPLKERFILIYLVFLWFVVPWFVISLYSGEISEYYFSINRFIVLFIISYLLSKILQIRNVVPKVILSCFLVYYTAFNISKFFSHENIKLGELRQKVLEAIRVSRRIEFSEGDPEAYFYYIYTRKSK